MSISDEELALLERGYTKKLDVCNTLQGTLMMAINQRDGSKVAIKKSEYALAREGITVEDGMSMVVCNEL